MTIELNGLDIEREPAVSPIKRAKFYSSGSVPWKIEKDNGNLMITVCDNGPYSMASLWKREDALNLAALIKEMAEGLVE